MWALIVFLIAGRGTTPLNDLTPLDTGRMVVGYIAMLILILILAPMPNFLWDSASDVCPYLEVRLPLDEPLKSLRLGDSMVILWNSLKLIEDFRKCHNLRVRSPLAMDHWTVRRYD